MKNRKLRFIWLPIILVFVLIGIIFYHTWQNQETNVDTNKNKINVVTSLDSYGEMAKAVLGNQGSVTSIINKPNMDPHEYEPTTSVAKQYQKADVIISNGGGFDNWSVNFAKQNKDAKTINIANIYHYKDGESGGNEHFWYKTDITTRLTNQLVKQYSQLLPKKASYFKKNAQAYQDKAKKLVDLQNQVKVQLAGKKLLATEPVFDNTLLALGANMQDQKFARAIEEGDDPTPSDVREWQNLINQGKIAVVIDNPQASGKLAKQGVDYAKAHGVPVVKARETKPANTTYIEWQMQQLNALNEALQK